VIIAMAYLIDAAENTRKAIIEHDLAAEPRGRNVFKNVEDLIADLRKP